MTRPAIRWFTTRMIYAGTRGRRRLTARRSPRNHKDRSQVARPVVRTTVTSRKAEAKNVVAGETAIGGVAEARDEKGATKIGAIDEINPRIGTGIDTAMGTGPDETSNSTFTISKHHANQDLSPTTSLSFPICDMLSIP